MIPLDKQKTGTERPVKALLGRIRHIRRAFNMLHRGGRSWPIIGAIFGRSSTWACRIAKGQYTYWTEESVSYIEERMPKPLWETYAQLDERVLARLWWGLRITGEEMAFLQGTTPRTIRGSIKRLRERGHNITASLAPPRGYRLEADDGDDAK